MRSRIKKEEIRNVIKPQNRVFLGHDIKDWQLSANANEAIAWRANKCVEQKIVFDYDHDHNCETSANLVLFDYPESTQAPKTHQTIKCKLFFLLV